MVKVSRKTFVTLLVAILAGYILYNVAPPSVEPGQYDLTLHIISDGINVKESFNITLIQSGSVSQTKHYLNGTSTNVTLTMPYTGLIKTDSPIRFTLNVSGDPLLASQIHMVLTNDDGFNVTLRPTHQVGQVFTIEYQPLVSSRASVMILGVVAILWFTEGISLVATSLLIPVLIVLTDIRTPTEALAPFFDPSVVLIFGGFLIGRALTKYELDKRLALVILSRSSSSGSA